jgi:hypothetical protein
VLCRRSFLLRLSALALPLPLSACGETLPEGTWLGIYDKADRIDILSPKTARITAIVGKALTDWYPTVPAATELGQQFDDAARALARLQMVDVGYSLDRKSGEVRFSHDIRGDRVLVRAGDDMLDDPASGLRSYLWQKRLI